MFADVDNKITRNLAILINEGAEHVERHGGDDIQLEVELRIRKYNLKDPLRRTDFLRTRTEFEQLIHGNDEWEIIPFAEDIVFLMTENYRRIHQGEIETLMIKKKLPDPDIPNAMGGIDSTLYPIRIGFAVEVTLQGNQKPASVEELNIRRERKRWSYGLSRGASKILRVDLTEVDTFRDQIRSREVEFFIEIEVDKNQEFREIQADMERVGSLLLRIVNNSKHLYTQADRTAFVIQINELLISPNVRGERFPTNKFSSSTNDSFDSLNKSVDCFF